jgi:sulfide:quinone oxidoreductase
MAGRPGRPTLRAMTGAGNADSARDAMRVLIVGGGVAGLETLLGLRALARDRVSVELLSPKPTMVDRPSSVRAPFGLGRPARLDVAAIAAECGAHFIAGALAEVNAKRHEVTTSDRDTLSYDALVVAVGATPHDSLAGARTFRGMPDVEGFRALLRWVRLGRVQRIVFAVPTGTSWTLPLYELALSTAGRLRAIGVATAELVLTTPESRPLELFGRNASAEVEALLESAGIDLITQSHPAAIEGDELVLVPDRRVRADRVVTLPRLSGPAIPGLPHDPDGFLQTDVLGRVRGTEDVYAAGDGTAFPIKQGGLAAQQADAVVESLAARAGVPIKPQPFRPVLRGLLLVGRAQRFLRSPIAGGLGDVSEVERVPLWWPPSKVAARHLDAYLAIAHGEPVLETGAAIPVEANVQAARTDDVDVTTGST